MSSKGKIEVNDLADFGWGITGGKEAVKTGFDFVLQRRKEEIVSGIMHSGILPIPERRVTLSSIMSVSRID